MRDTYRKNGGEEVYRGWERTSESEKVKARVGPEGGEHGEVGRQQVQSRDHSRNCHSMLQTLWFRNARSFQKWLQPPFTSFGFCQVELFHVLCVPLNFHLLLLCLLA